ncbi:MAG TPA: thioredoxin domain-containing protein [Gemmataceae bacterium]|nr:thioredoxin domain-containing protein [Gemmataceae bacterium]
MTQELTSDNFQQEVLQADVPVLVDFWGHGCPPCKAVAPVIDELARNAGGKYRVGKVNVHDHQDLGTEFRITAIPTLLIFKGGAVVRKFAGAQDGRTLLRALTEVA